MAPGWSLDGYTITCDPARIDGDAVHAFLATTYWATDVPRETVLRSIKHSLCFAMHDAGSELCGFARAITDRATFAYLCDVFIVERLRGRGLGKWLVRSVMEHPDLQGLRRFNLVTRDAHGLYTEQGFRAVRNPERYMERLDPDVYKRAAAKRLSADSKS